MTVTVFERDVAPPGPEHVNEYDWVECNGPTFSDPFVVLDPDHPPDALQLVTFELLQFSVVVCPELTVEGLEPNHSDGVPPALSTEIVTAAEVCLLPAASRAIAVSVRLPFVTCAVFQATE